MVQPRVEITIAGHPYVKHGTSIDIRLIVFDKGWAGTAERYHATNLAEALPIIAALPDRLEPSDPFPPASPVALPAPILRREAPIGGLLRGLGARPGLAPPKPPALPEVDAKPLVYSIRDEIRPAGEAAGIYVSWRLARLDIENAQPHPDPLVESIAMASVPPPVPSYRPILPERTVKALSDAQLEAIIHAGEAFERDLLAAFVRTRPEINSSSTTMAKPIARASLSPTAQASAKAGRSLPASWTTGAEAAVATSGFRKAVP